MMCLQNNKVCDSIIHMQEVLWYNWNGNKKCISKHIFMNQWQLQVLSMIELFFNFLLSFFHSFILWSFLSLNFSGIIAAVNQGCNYPLLSFFLSFILVLLYYKSVQNRSGGATMDSGSYLYQKILIGLLQRLSILSFSCILIGIYI